MLQLDTTNSTVSIGAAAPALALPVRGRRLYAFIHNPNTNSIYVYFTRYDSSALPGIILNENDTFEINPDNPWNGAIFVYSANAVTISCTDVYARE